MAEHVVRLAQAGALQNSQSPGVAVVDGDGTTVEPPLGSALVNIARMPKRSNVVSESGRRSIQISTIAL